MRKYCAGRSLAYPLAILDFFVDIFSKLFYKNRKREAINQNAPKILILSSGHLGDALILSYLFPLIKEKNKDAEIDLVVGDWCIDILKSNPFVNQIFIINHAKTNRKKLNSYQKWKDFWKTTQKTVSLLKKKKYDYSIDIRFSAYPFHFILPFINVNKTIGFGTRGFGGLLDSEFFMEEDDVHHLNYFKPLFEQIGVKFEIEKIKPYFEISEKTKESFSVKNKELNLFREPFIVFFPEAGEQYKMLSSNFWKELANEILKDFNGKIVVCGQTDFVDEISKKIGEKGIGLKGKLSLNEIPILLEKAEKIYCLDSLPAHLGSIFTKTICFSSHSLGISFFPINQFPTLCFFDHKQSKNKVFGRKDFVAKYVENIDNQVIIEASKF